MTRILPGMSFLLSREAYIIAPPGYDSGEEDDGSSPIPAGVHWFVATLMAVATTVVLVWLGADSTTAGLVFLVLVVWAATQAGIALSLFWRCFARSLSTTTFCRRFTPFDWRARRNGWPCSRFWRCVVVSRVAERARRQTRQAEQRREDVERLYELSQEMMLYEDAEGLMRELPRMIDRIFALDGVVLYVRDQDQFYASTAELPMSIQASMIAMTQGQIRRRVPGEIDGDAADAGIAAGGGAGLAAGRCFPAR